MIGETAAVLGSLLWSFCSIFFTMASKRIGVHNVNAIRIFMAVGILAVVHLIIFHTILPNANGLQWFYLGVSGFIGLALGDLAYFGCLVRLGPRKGVLIMATNPIFSVAAAYVLLGEHLTWWMLLGIAVTMSGVFWVTLEKQMSESGPAETDKKTQKTGILLGIGGAAGQGIGLVLSKYGMFNAADDPSIGLNPFSATFIRVLIAGICFIVIMVAMGKMPQLCRSTRDKRSMILLFGGALIGPFLGVWLSMVAVSHTHTGVAATLLSLMPIMIIPIVWVLFREKTSWRGIAGAAVAIIGVAILFLGAEIAAALSTLFT